MQRQPPQAHFQIDVTLLSGQFKLSNGRFGSNGSRDSECTDEGQTTANETSCNPEIPVGDETRYSFDTDHSPMYKLPEIDNENQLPDFNFDGQQDYIALLDENADDQMSSSYGVWFNLGDDQPQDGSIPLDEDGEVIEPDLIRYTKQEQNFDHLGLLSQISEDDLAKTDIYVFRESTGELVIEKVPFTKGGGSGSNGVAKEINGGYFELTIPGRDGQQSRGYFGLVNGTYEDWQFELDIQKAFTGNNDSLRAGEPIRVVAINRATGYVGTVRTNLTNTGALDSQETSLGVRIPNMVLYPPNLKVDVTRRYEIEAGLRVGTRKRRKIGFQGAALHSDLYTSVHTEWLDYDGKKKPGHPS